MWLLQLLLLQVICRVVVTSTCQEYYVGLIPEMNGRIRNYALIENITVKSIQSCTQECFVNLYCVTFFYNSRTKQCQTHRVVLLKTSSDTLDADWRYYQIYTEKCSQSEGLILFRKENTCYYLSLTSVTWENAKSKCFKRGWRLLRIPNKEVQDHFRLALPGEPANQYFFGLKSMDDTNRWTQISDNTQSVTPVSTNKWKWSNGEILTGFTKWAPVQNTQTGSTCVFLARWQNRNWNNEPCSKLFRFVCEKVL